MPLLHGTEDKVRDWAISEYDYVTREARKTLNVSPENARLVMCVDDRWKYVHAEGFRPMLFDLKEDPNELVDLGESMAKEHEAIRKLMAERIFEWARRHHNRTTRTYEQLEAVTDAEPPGILIGVWDLSLIHI